MAQNNFFGPRSDDSTFSLNQQMLGAVNPGVRNGFDLINFAALEVTINHSESFLSTVDGGGNIVERGVFVSKQGVTCTEELGAEYIINLTTSADRIDLIVLEHVYSDQVNNDFEVKVLEGTTPGVAPTPSNLQIPIYEVTILAGAITNINDLTLRERNQYIKDSNCTYSIGAETRSGTVRIIADGGTIKIFGSTVFLPGTEIVISDLRDEFTLIIDNFNLEPYLPNVNAIEYLLGVVNYFQGTPTSQNVFGQMSSKLDGNNSSIGPSNWFNYSLAKFTFEIIL